MLEKLRFLSSIGVSHTHMAKEIGVAKSTVNAWVSGLKGISPHNEIKVKVFLDNFKVMVVETL